MITYVKAGNSFIWGTPVRGLPIDTVGIVRIQHDGDYVGVREIGKYLNLNPDRKSFLLALRPVRNEIMKALTYGPDAEQEEIPRRTLPFKFRFFGSASEAYKRFLEGDYRFLLHKFDERNPKHRTAYVKAFLMAIQNPFLMPSEEELGKFLDYLRGINDSLLQGFYEEIRSFSRGSGTLFRVHNYVLTHEEEILREIKDKESAALWSYETGSPNIAKEIMKYSSGVRSHMAEATLAIYEGRGKMSDGFSLLASSDPDEVIIGFLIVMERMDELDPEIRSERMHNLHTAFVARTKILKNPNIKLPSYIVRAPILGKSATMLQFVRTVAEGVSDILEAIKAIPIYAEALPIEIRAHVAHDISLPYLYSREDPGTIIKVYKTIGQASLTPPERILLLPLFVAATYYDEDMKYPMERLMIYAKENEILADALISIKRALEINSGPVLSILERRYEEIRSSVEVVLELVETERRSERSDFIIHQR